jgi:regulator of protease activity HflC (stomatin/prohibitin superfamily)
MVSITLRVLSRPDVEHLPRIYQSLGMDYDERVLPSIGNEVLKAIVAQFDAAELITQREVVSHLFITSGQVHRTCAGFVKNTRRLATTCRRV